MGGQQSRGGPGGDASEQDKKDKKAKKYEQPAPTRVGRKKKKKSGPAQSLRLPTVVPATKCKLRLLKLERVKDYLLMEEEFVLRQEQVRPQEESAQVERSKVDDIRGSPMGVASLEEMIDDNHAIIASSVGPEYYVNIMSFVDKDQLEPGCSLLTHHKTNSIVGLLADETDPMVSVMKVDKAPLESYADIGGLETQIQEIKEAVELPLTHPELYEDIGIRPPKGVILYGEPGTGKTLLAKAVANQTSATFLRVTGSELIQKYLGDGPKLVRELFRVADEQAPTIVFIDEIDAVGTKRYDSTSGGEKEIQRTMLELLNQLDGFDARTDVKVILATNKIESLDPALIRPGRIDRKIEFPAPDQKTRRHIFQIHTSKMNLADVRARSLPHSSAFPPPSLPPRLASPLPLLGTPPTLSASLSGLAGCQLGGVHHVQGRAVGRRHQGHVHRGRSARPPRAAHEGVAGRVPYGARVRHVQKEGRGARRPLSVKELSGGGGAGGREALRGIRGSPLCESAIVCAPALGAVRHAARQFVGQPNARTRYT
jgi:26S proteasome regulatory subunit T2